MNATIQYFRSRYIYPLLLFSALSVPLHVVALEAPPGEQASFSLWQLIIGVFVSVVAGSVAYLCYGSVRLWSGYWKALALMPLMILALLLAFYVLIFAILSGSRPLWPFEVLSWAMGTTIYLVVLFTAKRTFEKAETE